MHLFPEAVNYDVLEFSFDAMLFGFVSPLVDIGYVVSYSLAETSQQLFKKLEKDTILLNLRNDDYGITRIILMAWYIL